MKKFEWSNEYLIGEDNIDNQHKHLFKILNNLIEERDNMGDSDTINTFNSLVRYSQIHFKAEEELMNKINYPYLEAHQKEHLYFIDELQRIYMEIEAKNMAVIFEMIIVLAKWLQHHILITDRRINEFL